MSFESLPQAPSKQAERHFSDARTPKHANRGVRRVAASDGRGEARGAARRPSPPSPPGGRPRPPSPQRYCEYGYGYGPPPRASRGMPPPLRGGYCDYYDRPHCDRYDYRLDTRHCEEPRDLHQRSPLDVRPRGESIDLHPASLERDPATAEMHGASSNNSLRAVSSSFSANESLQNRSVEGKSGLQIGCKHSPGVVTAADSLDEPKNSIPHPPSLSSKTTPTSQQLKLNPSSSPQSDSSWKQLQQIASIDTKDHDLRESRSEESEKVDKEVVVPVRTPRGDKPSPNGGHGLEKSISRTSSLSNSPTEEEFHDKFDEADRRADGPPAPTEDRYRSYYEARTGHPYPHERPHPPHRPRKHHSLPHPSMHLHLPPPCDENSPSASTISTKDTRSFFPSVAKPKHPVHLKTARDAEEGEADRSRPDEDASPANASDFGDLGAVPSWEKNLSGFSVCSGMTGMESLIKSDLGGNVLSAFSFGSEASKKKEEAQRPQADAGAEESPRSGKKRKQGHVQFSQGFDREHSARKRMHDGSWGMPPPHARYHRRHEDYPPYPLHEVPPHHHPPPHHPGYEPPPHPGRYPRYPPREYEDDPHYHEYGYPPRYDYRYRPPPPAYPYRPHEYDYPLPPRGSPGAIRPAAMPPQIHAVGAAAPVPGGWSKSDDLDLMEIMKKHRNVKNWDPIAKKLNRGKSGKECQDRWTRFLKPGSRKGQWTEAEDRIVFEAVSNSIEDPFTRWSDLAQQLPGRVGKQVRDRWVNHLNPAINHLPFSREDDLKLWEGHHALGKRWVEISSKYFHSTRSENHIKNRWYSASFKKFICGEFGPDAYTVGNEKGGIGDVTERDGEGKNVSFTLPKA